MTTNHHTPYIDGTTEFKASHMNGPPGELDAQITANIAAISVIGTPLKVLGSVNVDFSQTGNITLYTTVSGEVTIPMKVVVRSGADCGNTQVKIGTPAVTGEFLDTQNLSNLDAAGEVVFLQPIPNATPPKTKVYFGADTIQMTVVSGDGGPSNWVDLLGYIV